MATFLFIGDEPRTFDVGIGRAPSTVAKNDVLHIAGPATMAHAMNADLVPHDADTRRQVELIREQVRAADARDFAPVTPAKDLHGNIDATTPGVAEAIARSEGRSKGRG